MRLTIRTKLGAIVGAAVVAFVVLVVGANLIASRLQRDLETVQGRYLPKMDLGPRLAAEFESARRGFQDAVAAHDLDGLAEVRDRKNAMLEQLAAAQDVLDPTQATAVSRAIDEYFTAAFDVSRRLIAGETGEALLGGMGAMQTKQARALALLKAATTLDRAELHEAFESIARTQASASRIRLLLSAGCLALVISLALWLGRGVVRSIGVIEVGLQRFGKNDFSKPITAVSADELGDVAAQANQMAESLQRLKREGADTDWLKAGQAGLARELRGDLEPAEAAQRVAGFLARTLEAPAAALYLAASDGGLELVGQHAATDAEAMIRRFAPGEGLVGQAALQEEVTLVADPPPGYLRVRSGLGEAAPRALVLVSLRQGGHVTGVLELALFKDLSAKGRELLMSVRETAAIALEVARARAATRDLLAATQRQAERLARQEEELRATNEELQAQEEELRQANTDLHQQTEELETQRQMLADRNADLDEARVRLEQRAAELSTVSAYKSQFLANMSHELRTPLNSMLLLSNLLAENEDATLSPRQVEFARTIFGAGKDLLALINQVLDLAKVESGKQEIEIAPVAPRDVVEHAERVFGPLARDKGLAFEVVLGPDVPASLATDRRRLEQVLNNLLGNAIKFTVKGGITFRVERAAATTLRRPALVSGGAVAFSVTDTGLGIADENHDRVFAPFEQVDAAVDRRYGGTGLGLGIARELATLLGGELRLASVLGQGSTFTLFLPLTSPVEIAPAPRSATNGRARSSAPSGVVERPLGASQAEPFLLLIEDDPVFASTFAEIIQSQGLKCVQAASGQAGLRLARELKPQGIVLDVKLPDTDGWRVMEALRADPATAAIPVHFVSSFDASERGLALGAVGYLTKPVTRRDLVRVVDALSPRSASGAARVLVVEDDATTADSVLRMLETEKVEARRVSSATEAMAALKRERFGCMILDLSLPDMNGLELLRALRDEPVAQVPKVVVYTARALSRAETLALEAYAEAVVLKDGSSVERLLDEVRLFVRRLNDGSGPQRPRGPELPPGDGRFEGRRVLVVDDDMRTVYALSATLRAKGIEVVVADTGKAALDALDRRTDIEVVLMDIMMPEMDGYEAMRRIRADVRFGALPIIALTAKAMKGDAERCVEAGASHYLAKPIDADRLLTLLATCLPRAPEAVGA